MAKHGNFHTQGTGEGDSKALSSCRACNWAQWGPTGAGIQERIDAVQRHIVAAHPAYPMYEPPADIEGSDELIEALQREVENLRGLVSEMAEVLAPLCCHITGTHDPTHFTEGKYLCDSQKAEAWHRAILLLGLDHLASPDAAKGRPDSCPRCRAKNIAA